MPDYMDGTPDWGRMGSGLEKPDRGSGQKVTDQKEGTLNHWGVRLGVIKVCLGLMVPDLQLRRDGGYHVLCLHDYLR